jgi:hypothetical protein
LRWKVKGFIKKISRAKQKKWQKIGYFNRRRRVAIKIALTALVAYLVVKEFANVQTIKHGRFRARAQPARYKSG